MDYITSLVSNIETEITRITEGAIVPEAIIEHYNNILKTSRENIDDNFLENDCSYVCDTIKNLETIYLIVKSK